MFYLLYLLGDGEAEDRGPKPYEPSVKQHVKEQEQYQESKDLSSSWKAKTEEESAKQSKKGKEFGEPWYHSKNRKEPTKTNWENEEYSKTKESEQPFYQEVVTKHLEKPTKHLQVETKGPIVSVEKITEAQPTKQDLDDSDAELERKLEELTPSNNYPAEPAGHAVKVAATKSTTTFHHWRQFVDNNPNFPYTIPVKVKKTTVKPTTEKWHEPSTERTTTKKITTIKQQVRTQPHKMTAKKTTTEKAMAEKEKIPGKKSAKHHFKINLSPPSFLSPPIILSLFLPILSIRGAV